MIVVKCAAVLLRRKRVSIWLRQYDSKEQEKKKKRCGKKKKKCMSILAKGSLGTKEKWCLP